jgi:hypothetical protein
MGEATPEVMETLKKFKKGVQKYGVEKIILFGSQASGGAGGSSDVDLLIVSDEREKLSLLRKLYHEWHVIQKIDYPVDFICYTPEEFERLKKQVTLVKKAVEEGVET